MARLIEILKHPSELYPLLKLRMAVKKAAKDIPNEPHWGFCYYILPKVSRSYALVIQELGHELRQALCIFYLVLRALDTIEDDTSLSAEVKVPILYAFHNHVYDRDWHFSCGRNAYKILMDEFHHVSTAFMELKTSYQEIIKDTTKTVGAGMAKFICNKIETIDDYDEYCHYAAALVGLGLSKIFHASGREVLLPESLCYSMGLFLQKANIIRDYLDDINETPKPLLFWPPEIWSKYVDKLEDLKSEENLDKAVLCLNEMITDALVHVENCLKYLSCLHDRRIFRFCALPQIIAMGRLALFYDDSRFFKGKVNIRLGLKAKISHRTRTMADVYGAFFDFSSLLKSKVDKKKAKPTILLSRLETIQRICRESGTLNKWKHYII